MNALIFADQLTYEQPGGLGKYIARLHENMSDVRGKLLVCSEEMRTELSEGSKESVERLPYGRAYLGIAWHGLRAKKVEKMVSGRFDLVHAPTLVIPSSSLPIVTTIADLAPIQIPETFPIKWRVFLRRGLSIAVKESKRIICISRSIASEMESVWPNISEKITVIHLASDFRLLERESIENEERPVTLLYVGTIEPRKNLENLVNAFLKAKSSLKNTEIMLEIAGPYGWGVDREIFNRKGINYLGKLSEEELKRAYGRADLFVYVSKYEGFGLPVLEAMSTGLPVIASKIPAIEEVAGQAAFFVDPKSVEDIRDAIISLCSNRAALKELSEAALKRAECFSWKKTARETEMVYRSVID